MRKADLRKLFISKRETLDSSQIESYSKKIKTLFFENFNLTHKSIHVFMPINHQKEVNTHFILDSIFDQETSKIVTSKSDFTDNSLTHYKIDSTTKFEIDKYKIPYPTNATEVDVKEINIVLVPLLCFDKKGHRVGYGKGFYDRFLNRCNSNTITIGLSFFDPLDELISDINSFDKPLNYCITPKTIHHFK